MLCAVWLAAGLLAFGWVLFDRRRTSRAAADKERESILRSRRREAEREAGFRRQVGQVLTLADYFCRYSAQEQGLALFEETAEQHPMPQRPEPPDPEPGEPWQLNLPADAYPPHQVPGRKAFPSRLVERGDSEINPLGGES